ncbi:methyl-accepting chemotaxis protein [Sporomusa sphaeroides]|jgi:methyl-accepting chemotaxis protein|uniref:methyl-accepting chemotaxis protein n=1 Tax=Sporomusa sphaeroides TaxID=47679 RepID=UPI002BA13C3B|nr:methyl-accepting chemotaxis protein [Sporomusa sphaeroides]HML35468.1 methyl-accepting chemotaxis protein [Sporomusa sphaeroides]
MEMGGRTETSKGISSIRKKLIGILVSAVVVGLALSSFLIYETAQKALVENTEQSIQALAVSSGQEVGLWLNEQKSYITTLANSPLVEVGNVARTWPYLAGEMARATDYDVLFVANEKGDYFSATRNDRGGIIQGGANVGDREYFPEVMKGKTVISDPVISKTSGHLVVVVAVPLKRDGRVVGMIGGSMNIEKLMQKISGTKVYQTGYAFLVQGDGLVIAHPEKSVEMKSNFLKEGDLRLRQALTEALQGKQGITPYRWGEVDKYAGYAPVPGSNWALVASVPADEVHSRLTVVSRISFLTPLFVAVLIIGVTGLLLTKWLIRPLNDFQSMMAVVETGDFTVRGKIYANDEIGALTGAVNHTLQVLGDMVGDIRQTTGLMKDASVDLIDVSTTLAANSEQMSAQISTISATVEEISAGIEETASSAEEVSHGVDAVAGLANGMSAAAQHVSATTNRIAGQVDQVSEVVAEISQSINRVAASAGDVSASMAEVDRAVQEISCSLGQVGQHCDRSIHITLAAENQSQETTAMIQKLSITTKRINQIVDVIRSIAEQTNMLALNATIEAAGAGEAGKGFAVVAAEVKELAKRTAEETRHIARQIEEMHSDMGEAVGAVSKIATVITETTGITRTIASAVSEQSRSVGNITTAMTAGVKEVAGISKEISDIADHAQQVSQMAAAASEGVRQVDEATADISVKAVETAKSADQMSALMGNIVLATKEIAQGTQNITESIQEADAATADMAGTASHTSGSASELGETAHHLEQMMAQFKI